MRAGDESRCVLKVAEACFKTNEITSVSLNFTSTPRYTTRKSRPQVCLRVEKMEDGIVRSNARARDGRGHIK